MSPLRLTRRHRLSERRILSSCAFVASASASAFASSLPRMLLSLKLLVEGGLSLLSHTFARSAKGWGNRQLGETRSAAEFPPSFRFELSEMLELTVHGCTPFSTMIGDAPMVFGKPLKLLPSKSLHFTANAGAVNEVDPH
jgi:hypothetical protein